MRGAAVVLLAAAVGALGCDPVTLQARNSVNPLLLGPVHRIGGGKLEPGVGALITSQSKSASASSSTQQQGNVQVTTTTSQSSKTAPSQTDLDLALVSDGELDRGYATDEVDCDGYFFFLLTGMVMNTDCEMEAPAVALTPPSAPAAKPTSPRRAAPPAAAPPAASEPAAPAAAAPRPTRDVVTTTTGRKLRGKVLVDDSQEVVILLPNDETVKVPRAEVESVRYAAPR